MKKIWHQRLLTGSLIQQILLGLIAGVALAALSKPTAIAAGMLGLLFVSALKSIGPLLVLLLIISAIANHQPGQKTHIRPIIILYLLSTFLATLVAVTMSHLLPQTLILNRTSHALSPPSGILEVLKGLLMKMVVNPFDALINANYIGILVWGVGLGLAFRHASSTTRCFIDDASQAVSWLVRIIIHCAPVGIFGLVASEMAKTGLDTLWRYAHLLALLLGSMLLMALIINPLLVYWKLRRNPWPLVFTCLRESGITAFFTRSSAANIPVNMALAKKLKLDEETYTISIPLGANISMAGASITITILTLAAVNTLGIQIDIPSAILLSVIATICACGCSSVAGGSLLLVPVACNMFGIPNDIAMQVVAIGFIISVLQDACETALNSSADILFTAAVCLGRDQELAGSEADTRR